MLYNDETIDYCGLVLGEVCAESCVECRHWDFCEYVPAMVIPDLLELLAHYSVIIPQTCEAALAKRELHDIAMSVAARLKGEHYVEANDEVPL